ncbi:MAG: glycosyltransferase [Planctomycetota bacterium]|nr:MAG: glycosyltransferase [Planctomycetota bacterium]
MSAAARPRFSVVIPAYDEEPNIRPLAQRIADTFARMGVQDWEIVFVENGSRDGSLRLLEELHAADPRVKYLSLSRNFGHSGAVCCGFDHAGGEHVVLMDGDQQDPPELIAQFWDKMQREALDVVYGVRARREREPWLKRLGMKLFYRIWRRTAYVHVPLDAGNFCLMKRGVVDAICSMRERGRFVPGLRAFVGFRQDGIPFERPPRGGGQAKTSFAILTGIALEGLLAFSVFPLRLLMLLGAGAMAFSVVVSAVLLVLRALFYLGVLDSVPGFTWNSVFMILMAGAQMLGIGVIGEYVGRVYQEVKQRPIYVVRTRGL